MVDDRPLRSVRTEIQLRVTWPDEPGRQAAILELLRREGGSLRAHLVHSLGPKVVGLFLCERPEEAAAAFRKEGVDVETETVVVTRTEDHGEAVGLLHQTLEAEGIRIGYSYASGWNPDLCLVLRTEDNPKAEDVLRDYLLLEDGGAAEEIPGGS